MQPPLYGGDKPLNGGLFQNHDGSREMIDTPSLPLCTNRSTAEPHWCSRLETLIRLCDDPLVQWVKIYKVSAIWLGSEGLFGE